MPGEPIAIHGRLSQPADRVSFGFPLSSKRIPGMTLNNDYTSTRGSGIGLIAANDEDRVPGQFNIALTLVTSDDTAALRSSRINPSVGFEKR
jgi:hypothetical protein